MANFATHLKVATVVSAAASSILYASHIIDWTTAAALLLTGALAGLLPDIDADNSTSMSWLFSLFGLAAAGITLNYFEFDSLLMIWLAATIAYFTVTLALKPLFAELTIHRATLHSLLACLLFAFIGFYAAQFAHLSFATCLLIGLFIILGSVTHLILDELYSVDLDNAELKASFGSALKPFDWHYPLLSLLQLCLIVVAAYFVDWRQAQSLGLEWLSLLSRLTWLPA